MKYMFYAQAMAIVNQYGADNGMDSLMDCISDMEDNRPNLSGIQMMALDIVIGEMESYYAGY
jgi:hypothetical protein